MRAGVDTATITKPSMADLKKHHYEPDIPSGSSTGVPGSQMPAEPTSTKCKEKKPTDHPEGQVLSSYVAL